MPAKKQQFDEKSLTKGEVRKLNALKRTLGDEKIATDAFAKWLAKKPETNGHTTDLAAEKIAAALQKLRDSENLSIPRGGYIVRSGRGRVIVEPAASAE